MKCRMNVNSVLVANSDTTLLMQPAYSSFNHPTAFSQAAAVFCTTIGEERRDSKPAQNGSGWLRLVGAVCIKRLQWGFRMSSFSSYLRNRDNQRQKLLNIRGIRTGDADRHRYALPIDHYVMLCAGPSPNGGVRAGCLATANCSNTAGIHGCARPVDHLRAMQFRQHNRLQLVPYARGLPVCQSPPIRSSRSHSSSPEAASPEEFPT
jgi:hypothetical protein